jgi:PAS domain S-box-containing protein
MYKTLFNGVQAAIFIADVESGILIDCNEAACTLIERQKKELIGKYQSFLHTGEEQAEGFTKSFRKHFTSEPERVFSSSIITKSGIIKDVEIKANVLTVSGKKIIQEFFNDITEKKCAEKALQALSSWQEAILAAVPDIIVEVDSDKKYTWANKAGLEFFGDDVIGREACYYFEGEQNIYDKVQPLFIGDDSVIYIESWQRRSDGQIRLLAWWCRVLKDENGRVTGALSTARDITDRKRDEEASKENNIFLQTLLNAIPAPIFYKDKDGRYIGVNKSFEIFFGKTSQELAGKTVFELSPPELADIYHAKDTELIRHPGVQVYDSQVKDSHGVIHEVVFHKASFMDSGGHVHGLIGVLLDITERKLAEETIIEERTLLKTLIDNLPNGVFVKDKEYRKIIANPIHLKEVNDHLKYLGINAEIDILGKTDFEVFPKELAEKFITDDQKVIRDGFILLNIEGLGYYEDGGQQWLLVSKIPLRDKNGDIIGMVGVTTDISEQRHSEEALKTSEEKFRTIFNNASDGMFLIEVETRKFMMCNSACSKMLGYSHDEFLKLNIAAIHTSEELHFISEQIEKILRGEKEIRGDVTFKRKDGTVFTADISPTLVTIAEKLLILVVFRDITERLHMETELRSAKEKAEESDQLKTAFLHNISHEIRTPMNGIIGFSDIITNPNLSPEKRKQFSQIIRNSSDQLLSIVNDIISIATIESGHEKPHEKESNINMLLELIKNQNSLKTETKNISFTVSSSLTDDEATIFIDETKLIQILSNLIGNAIKYTNKGYIKVKCRLDGNFIKFSIEDTGIGIPPEMHEKIFDRFFQIDHRDTRLYGGTGLGLSIVKSYIHFLNGEIQLDSKPGKGSVFIISIPYKPVKKLKPLIIPVHDHLKQIGSVTILIAEDETANFELLNEYLSEMNLTIIYVANGLQAVEACKNNPFISLVLMDVKMPLMDGYEASRQIKEFRPRLPIIIQSAYIFQNERKKSMSAYVDGFLEKPIKQDELLETLRKNL